ncbi:MAG: N-acetylglucosamine-6-phosphate deacetylase [Planctomycetota bacterium]
MKGIQAKLWNGRRFATGWMTWKAGRIDRISFEAPTRSVRAGLQDLGQSRIAPGFVDTLLHGFGGIDCGEGNAAQLDRMSRGLAATGVTTAYAGFYPLSLPQLRSAARRWNTWKTRRGTARTRFPGWHLEGPFLAPSKRGALPRKDLQKPSAQAAQKLITACGGWLSLCTIAPELKDVADAAEVLRKANVMPSIGHSEATHLDCTAMAANGPVAMTHLGNGMPPFHVREPGPLGFAMEGSAEHVAVIPDMIHVAPETLQLWARNKAMKGSLMACSDNLSHAGLPAEDFKAGGLRLRRSGAVAVDRKDALAGTLDTLPELLFRAHRDGYLSLADVFRLGCTNPGRLAGDCGSLEQGKRADFLVVEEDLGVGAVWIGGRRV